MTATPLLDRIDARRKPTQPVVLAERMSPFMRRLAEKNLPVADKSGYIRGAWTPAGSDGAA